MDPSRSTELRLRVNHTDRERAVEVNANNLREPTRLRFQLSMIRYSALPHHVFAGACFASITMAAASTSTMRRAALPSP